MQEQNDDPILMLADDPASSLPTNPNLGTFLNYNCADAPSGPLNSAVSLHLMQAVNITVTRRRCLICRTLCIMHGEWRGLPFQDSCSILKVGMNVEDTDEFRMVMKLNLS